MYLQMMCGLLIMSLFVNHPSLFVLYSLFTIIFYSIWLKMNSLSLVFYLVLLTIASGILMLLFYITNILQDEDMAFSKGWKLFILFMIVWYQTSKNLSFLMNPFQDLMLPVQLMVLSLTVMAVILVALFLMSFFLSWIKFIRQVA